MEDKIREVRAAFADMFGEKHSGLAIVRSGDMRTAATIGELASRKAMVLRVARYSPEFGTLTLSTHRALWVVPTGCLKDCVAYGIGADDEVRIREGTRDPKELKGQLATDALKNLQGQLTALRTRSNKQEDLLGMSQLSRNKYLVPYQRHKLVKLSLRDTETIVDLLTTGRHK